jgi:hypothetical protein
MICKTKTIHYAIEARISHDKVREDFQTNLHSLCWRIYDTAADLESARRRVKALRADYRSPGYDYRVIRIHESLVVNA